MNLEPAHPYDVLTWLRKVEPTVSEVYYKQTFEIVMEVGATDQHQQTVTVELFDAGPDVENLRVRYHARATRQDGKTHSSNPWPTARDAIKELNWIALKLK